MTIIEPNKNNHYSGEFLFFGLAILILVILSINFYNLNVNLKYRASLLEKAIQQLETANADLRDELYQTLDGENLAVIVGKQNLISDKNPDYIEHRSLANR